MSRKGPLQGHWKEGTLGIVFTPRQGHSVNTMDGNKCFWRQCSFLVRTQRIALRWGPPHPKVLLKFSGPDKKAPAYSALALCPPPAEKAHQGSDSQIAHERSYFCQTGNCEPVLEVQSPTVTLSDLPWLSEAAKAVIEAGAGDPRVGAYLSWKKGAR